MKLSCCMIIRDCADTLEAALQSIRPHVQELVCVDTGSTDETPEIARKYADKFDVFLGCNNLETGLIEDFAMARNHSFSLATGDAVCWLDSDDIIEGAEHIKPTLEDGRAENAVMMLPYEYSFDPQGRCVCYHWRERVFRPPHAFHWESPVHEVCVPHQPIAGSFVTIRSDKTRIIHRSHTRTKPKEEGRNLRIIKAYIDRIGEGDPRIWYYAGLEYGYVGDYGGAIRHLRRYVELSQWYDEKCLAMLELARIYSMIGDFASAIDWALKASIVRRWPEPYWRLGRIFFSMAMNKESQEYNFKRAAAFTQLGHAMGDNDTVLFVDPLEKYRAHEFLNICLSALGDIKGAIESCEEGLRGMPENTHLQNNLAIYRQKLAEKAANDNDQVGFAEPASTRSTPESQPVLSVSVSPHRPPQPGKLDLVFLVGHQVEPWNPDTVAHSGIGGSETMAMHLARLLAAKGHAVRIYGQCTPAMEGVFEDVQYLDASRYRNVKCDVLIASRKPEAVDDAFGLRATVKYLWLHDVHVGEQLTFVRDVRFDYVLALSQWHKQFLQMCYPLTSPAKILVTRNGIDLGRFSGSEERDPHRAVYSSSPDRGLLALLEMWPAIQAQVPDATLHVYYGFANWKKTSQILRHEGNLRDVAHLEHVLRTTPAVIMHDRINQKELAREFMRSGVWAYPTFFTETSCVTAMEAQAAGLHIVSTAMAALNETVASRGVLLPWDRPREDQTRDPLPEYKERFVAEVVKAMLEPRDRGVVMNYATAFDINGVADEWDEMLTRHCAEQVERLVPRFYDVPQVYQAGAA